MYQSAFVLKNERNGDSFHYRPSCLLCGHPDPLILFSEDFGTGDTWTFLQTYYKGRLKKEAVTGTPYELRRCKGCGLIWQAYVLTDSWSGLLYEQWISPEESLEKERANRARSNIIRASQVSLISSLIGSQEPQDITVLDFGMGWGSWCLLAAAAGFRTYGVEISPSRIAHAEVKGISVIQDLSKCTQSFAYINVDQVLEHVAAPTEILQMLTGALRPKGLVRIGVPDGRKFWRRFRLRKWKPCKDSVHPLEHVNCFSHRTIIRLARQTGLKPVSALRLIHAVVGQLLFGRIRLYCAASIIYLHVFGTGIVFEGITGD